MYIFLGVMLFSIALMIGLGIAIKYFQAYWLISGYNMMPKEQKAKVNVVGLANFTGNMCFIMGAIMAVATIFIMTKQETLGMIAFGAFIPLTIYIVIKSQQFDGNTRNKDGSTTTKSKLIIITISSIMILTGVGVGLLLFYSDQPANFAIDGNQLSISGMYGEKIPLEAIEELTLYEELPKILMRTNGSSLGTKKKGYFRLEGIDKAKLFLDTSKPPFILLVADGKYYIFNCKESVKTQELYEELSIFVK